MMRVLLALAVALAALAAVVVAKTLSFRSLQVHVEPTGPENGVEPELVARHLAEAIRYRTVSPQDPADFPEQEFVGFRGFLERTYPRVHASLALETVGEHTLLYEWRGRSPDLAPGLLMAHSDVVPVDPGSEGAWVRPPFAGDVHEGEVWGRGALDDKEALVCIFEAVESLLAEGFRPERTLYLLFGHDEELGGEDGAQAAAKRLGERGLRFAYVVDEGGTVVQGVIPAVEVPIALIGIAEKGSVGIKLSVETEGGHSSIPPPQTGIGILAAAIDALDRNPMPARVGPTTRLMIRYLGPELGLPGRLAAANLWLLTPVLTRFAGAVRPLAAMTRTTTAATMFESGVKENVLPRHAEAVVNFRILPGDTVDDVAEHVRATIADDRVALQVGVRSTPRNPSSVSRVDTEGFALLQRSIGEIFPAAIVVPYLVVGGTDARYFHALSDSVYRFGPFQYDQGALSLMHGTNERISIENLGTGVRFYRRLIRNANAS